MHYALKIMNYPMVWVALALIVGVVLCESFALSGMVACAVFGVGAAVALVLDFVWGRSGMLLWLSIVLIGFLVSLFQRDDSSIINYDVKYLYIGVVESEPKELFTESNYPYRGSVELVAARDTTGRYGDVSGKILCYLDSSLCVSIGDTIAFEGKVRELKGDYGEYLRRKGFVGRLYGYNSSVVGHSEGSFDSYIQNIRTAAAERIYRLDTLKSQSTAIMAAMTVGERERISPETTSSYRSAGVSHLLAISGLHIGIVVMLLNVVFSSLKIFGRRGRVVYSVVIILMLWAYALFSGMALSVERAAIMFTLYQVALMCNRSGVSLNLLATSAVVILMISPMSIYDIGFQLSFVAMIGISVFYRPFVSLVSSRVGLVRLLWSVFALSLSAQLAVLPLVAYHFGTFAWLGLILSPLVWVMTPVIIVCTLLYLVSGWMVLGEVGRKVVEFQNWVFEWIGGWDLVYFEGIDMRWWEMVIIYVAVVAFGVVFNRYCNLRSRRKVFSSKQR